MKISDKGIDLICGFEDFRAKAYKCQAGVWTIGYGHTKGVKPGDHITMEGAVLLLKQDLKDAQAAIEAYIKVPLSQNQYDALSSFIFNLGVNNFKDSTLLKKLNVRNYRRASKEFLQWNKVKGEISEDLTKRREAERKLFVS
ncbi:lysozyme [Bacteroidetes bacterium endosymbiont of Geopemphigus sp.]|uniref:lysozyme n=1 Tax=Bacteroidetes bacterium endosymbiont of Geopemphigus sp. TaxID=2047937 RepID=UPI000CD196EC|nr:lysozyme [Bacteroidetes bacterium endosymbiont of Geopemphigus sp.]